MYRKTNIDEWIVTPSVHIGLCSMCKFDIFVGFCCVILKTDDIKATAKGCALDVVAEET